jgi:hypothetical protein
VALYTVTVLFLIGLEADLVKDLAPMTASTIVLAQLLPLPLAASIFFFVARRMSLAVVRKRRGIGEQRLMLNNADSMTVAAYVTVEEIYRRDVGRDALFDNGV